MKTELIDVSPTRKEIKIEIEAAQIRSTYDRISERYSKAATVPGFRPGHAPTSVVRARYKSEIRGEVLRELLPDAVNSALDEHSLAAIAEPNVQFDEAEALQHLGEKPITVTVSIEVLPEIKLDTYKGLEAVRLIRPVTEPDIDHMINSLRNSSASLEPVEDRASELGDTVTINARGKMVDLPDAEEFTVEDVEIELGGQGVQQEFTDNLQGVKPDDKRTFVVDYPEDFSTPGLAAKKVQYEAEVTAVRRKELPDVDDEWAKSLGAEFDSVATLRTRVREDLEARSAAQSNSRLRSEVIRKLLEGHPFEVPESLVNRQANQRLEGMVREMIGRGVDPRSQDVNWEGAHDEMKAHAEDDVRATMLLERIADEEQITVSDDEVEAEIEALTVASRQPKEQVRAALTKNGGERSIAHRLRNRKALDFLIENASVTEAEWNEQKDAGEKTSDE